MVDLSSGDDDSTRPAASFVPRPLDSSKMAQTPPEYQDDAISIADNDQEEQEGDGGSPVVIAEHTTRGDVCESSEDEEVGGKATTMMIRMKTMTMMRAVRTILLPPLKKLMSSLHASKNAAATSPRRRPQLQLQLQRRSIRRRSRRILLQRRR